MIETKLTQVSGYLAKQLLAALQTEVLDEYGTDCKTTKTLDITLTQKNKGDYLYRYIVSGSKFTRLDPDIIDKYVGKTVKMRSPMYCKCQNGGKICNICAGDMNYKLDSLYIGLTCSKVAGTLVNMGMKKFHISTLKSNQIDVDDMLV